MPGPDDASKPTSEAFDILIDGLVAVASGADTDGFMRRTLEEAMEGMAREGVDIREPIRRIWDGDRDFADLTKGLSPIEMIPVSGTLAALDGGNILDLIHSLPESIRDAIASGDDDEFAAAVEALPEEEQAAIFEKLIESGLMGQPDIPLEGPLFHEALEPLLIAVAEVARGVADPSIKSDIEDELAFLAEVGRDIREPVQRIWKGERDAAALTKGLDANGATAVSRILALIAEG